MLHQIPVPASRVAFFTAGTTGAGHLVRGIAIERALARAGSRCTYAMFGPRSPLSLARRANYHPVSLDPAELSDHARAPGSELAGALAAFAPDVLLVDLFWAPLRLLLPLPSCESWLLLRRAPPAWLVGPPGHPYERSAFARVLAIEPGVHEGQVDQAIDPIVVSNPDERRPVGALRQELGVPPEEPLVVAHQAGEPGDWARLVRTSSARPLHVFTPPRDDDAVLSCPADVVLHDGNAFFPLAEWLRDADAIVSGAGYNAYWEARWLGHGQRTTFVPFDRVIDDQSWRVRECGNHRPRENGADMIARWLG
jgi:hypothetical protein